MTPIEQFWADLMESRRYAITEVYGAECASRYRPHHMEKEYFINNNGTFSEHPSVTEHTKAFWIMCETHYITERDEMQKRQKQGND